MALTLTVLGSGGPIANPRRASSGYLIALGGSARILVDAGGGTYERLGRVGVDVSGLELVLLTHTHIDHSGGLPPVVFDLYMNDRGRPLAVIGPSGRDMHPGCGRFTELLFGRDGARPSGVRRRRRRRARTALDADLARDLRRTGAGG